MQRAEYAMISMCRIVDKQCSMQCTVQGAPDSVRPTSISSMTRWQTCDADFPCALGGGLYLKHLTSSGMSDSVCMIWTSCADDITMRAQLRAEQSQAVVCAGFSELPRDLQAGDLTLPAAASEHLSA